MEDKVLKIHLFATGFLFFFIIICIFILLSRESDEALYELA